MVKALAIYKDNSGCDYHRVRLPFRYAGDRVDNSAFTGATGMDDLLQRSELVTWNRLYPFDLSQLISAKRETGIKLVVDLDDYWKLNPGHYLYGTWSKQDISNRLLEILKIADAVTVTTDRLAMEAKEVNRHVHVIPNALPYGFGQFAGDIKRREGYYSFIYAGGQSHLPDLKIIEGPLKRIAGERRNDVSFTLAGHQVNDPSGIWGKMETIMSAGGRMSYNRIPSLPIDSYMSAYQNADAVLVPLETNSFNPFKSNLKILEAATFKLPVICQNVPPYSDSDAPVMWVNKTADWYTSIRYLVKNPQYGIDLGEKLHEWATSRYNLFAWNKYRFDLYEYVVNC